MTPDVIYEQRINAYREELAQVKRRLSNLGYLRLFSFVLLLLFGYRFFYDSFAMIWLMLMVLMAGVFAMGLMYYVRALDKQRLLKTLLELNEKEWRLATTGQSGFYDGAFFADEQHPYTGDLDVFGHASLYGHINRTGTLQGAHRLGVALKSPLHEGKEIGDMQQVVRTLMPKLEFRQHFAAQAKLAEEKTGDVESLEAWLRMPLGFINRQWLKVVRWGMPALMIGALVYYAITGVYQPAVIVWVINLVVLGRFVREVNRQHELLSNKEGVIKKFAFLLELMLKEDMGQAALLQQEVRIAQEANTALRQFAKICNALDQRLNMIVAGILNSLLLYDIHCMFALEKWKEKNKAEVMKWVEVIARMEVYNSYATFAYNHPEYIYPEIGEQQVQLEAKGVGHPLIPAGECVRNDISIGMPQHFLIITGSNMSGKSTFLRSVGSNLLLALCGMPVCADTFRCSPMQIMTSMRIKDSIAKHTSYFQAELLRLQQIVQVLKEGMPVFILLDEILKGTNSEDKLSGSRSLIAHFLQYKCLGMIATHDLELGHMENEYPQSVRNYCFESMIKEEQLFFDYRIREGVARNKNATFLMKKMEII